MQGAILVYGSSRTNRQEKVVELVNSVLNKRISGCEATNPDVLIIKQEDKKNNIGIGEIRNVISFLTDYPFQEQNKVVIILQAESLTVPAQNALLKTLEEPPAYALIILEAKSENALLETIVSRCQKVRVVSQKNEEPFAGPVQDKMVWAEEVSKMDKQEIVDLLENWVLYLRQDVQKNHKSIKLILQVAKDLDSTNVNVRLALEYLVLHLLK